MTWLTNLICYILAPAAVIAAAAYLVTRWLTVEAERTADLLLDADWDDDGMAPTPLFDQCADDHPWIRQQLDRAEFERSVLADIDALAEVDR